MGTLSASWPSTSDHECLHQSPRGMIKDLMVALHWRAWNHPGLQVAWTGITCGNVTSYIDAQTSAGREVSRKEDAGQLRILGIPHEPFKQVVLSSIVKCRRTEREPERSGLGVQAVMPAFRTLK